MSEIPFNVQIDRVLDLLCSQIYDSPLSLLRENVQNAYDAILQRLYIDKNFLNPEIHITIDGNSSVRRTCSITFVADEDTNDFQSFEINQQLLFY